MISNPYLETPTEAFLPSGEPKLLSSSLNTSGFIVIFSPDILLSISKYPLTKELEEEELTTPLLIWVEKVSLDTNFSSPLIWAETFFVSLISINIFLSRGVKSSLSVSK